MLFRRVDVGKDYFSFHEDIDKGDHGEKHAGNVGKVREDSIEICCQKRTDDTGN